MFYGYEPTILSIFYTKKEKDKDSERDNLIKNCASVCCLSGYNVGHRNLITFFSPLPLPVTPKTNSKNRPSSPFLLFAKSISFSRNGATFLCESIFIPVKVPGFAGILNSRLNLLLLLELIQMHSAMTPKILRILLLFQKCMN